MTFGMAIGVTAAVTLASGTGAYLYSTHHFRTLVESAQRTAISQGELMRTALEHQMMENDRTLIADLVHQFAREAGVSRLMLLDREGAVRYASTPPTAADDLTPGSPTCQACHQLPAGQRETSRVIDTRGGSILRTVIPIPNRQACHTCHAPSHRINGVMVLDLDAGELRASMNRDLRWLVVATGVLALLLAGAIALIVRFFLLWRLQRFETTARLIAGGDLGMRVPSAGTDTISWLAREFNTMADSMTGLVTEVRSQRERLENVINSIDDGIVVLDERRKVVAANDAFLQRAGSARPVSLGCSCGELAGQACTALDVDCPTLRCLNTGERQVRIAERRLPDGSVRWEEVHASPIYGQDGNLLQVVEVWRDISDRRAAEARLAESHRMASLGMLASGFSHEMNTPLGTVLMCVEGILRDVAAQADGGKSWARVGDSATIAREQILRCRGITQHFLRMSRGQGMMGDLIEVGPVMAAVARLVEPTARQIGVTVTVVPVPAGTHVWADEAELQHALINLALNGIQACTAGGTVTLAATPGAPVRLSVTDNLSLIHI